MREGERLAWTVAIVVLVPFGWVYPLLRLAYRLLTR